LKEKISPYELFAVLFLVPYGSAVLFFITPDAKQDSWIVLLIYILPALQLQYIYITLYRNYPQDTLITWLPKIFGKVIGKAVGILYIVYFAYIAARVLRDFVGLISIAAMSGTSLTVLTIALGGTVIYGVYTGVENMSRIASTYFIFLMLLVVSLIILYFGTPNIIQWENLQPILPKGVLEPVIKSWRAITFPYGETIVGAMLYVHVNEPKKINKVAYTAIIVEGIILAFVHVCYIIGLGVNFATRELFPLMDILRLIKVSGFLDRLDLFIVIVIVFNCFIKIGFFMYCAAAGMDQWFGMKKEKALVLPMGITVCIASFLISKNFPQHLKVGLDITPKYIHLPMQIGIPVLALVVHYVRKGSKKKTTEQKDNQCPKNNS
jgi:spore germination protein KB